MVRAARPIPVCNGHVGFVGEAKGRRRPANIFAQSYKATVLSSNPDYVQWATDTVVRLCSGRHRRGVGLAVRPGRGQGWKTCRYSPSPLVLLSVATKSVAVETGRWWDLEASASRLGQSSSQLSDAGWFASLLGLCCSGTRPASCSEMKPPTP